MTTATTAIPPSYSQQQQQQQQQYHQQQYQKQQAFDLPNMQYEAKPHRQVQHIGNYVIYRKTLGSGSMGTVKLAECLSDKDHQKYAVKIMPKINLNTVQVNDEKTKDPKDTPREREQRTIREMAIMHLLRHPNICQLKEWIVSGDSYYMFLEYIEGGQLLDYIISHGKLREKLARKFARQIVSALDYCHRNSIVHRDLKIENILITHNEEIKIIDFGLSNVYSPGRVLNTFCGSLYFAAPELLQARHYTGPEVDVWSFGVVLYVLVCGRVPFDDTSLPALHQKIKAGHVEYPDHLSKDCVDLLSKILVVDPLKRETLSFVLRHPWLNKAYDEFVFNHLPHRQPLQSIDRQVIKGMQGFGLGSPEEIERMLHHIISSKEYQQAATQIDRNYKTPQQQKQQMSEYQQQLSRWRRSSVKKKAALKDDPQTLPAMYDPFISIYYLVKERKEFDEKMRLLENNSYYKSPVQLGRSASTSIAKSSTRATTPPSTVNSNNALLQRRKTERVPPSHRRQQQNTNQDGIVTDWASPINRSSSVRSSSKILQRSKSAAKRLGAMLPSSSKNSSTEEHHPMDDDHHDIQPLQEPDDEKPPSSLKKTMSLFRSNSLTERRYRTKSIKRSNPSSVQDETSSIQSGGRFIEEELLASPMVTSTPKMSTHPKSLFNFNRRHLFKLSASDMMKGLQQVLYKLNIRFHNADVFTLSCQCDDWRHLIIDEGISENAMTTLRFTIMVYQARWANGRLGVKLIEAEDENSKIYRSIYHAILNELSLKYTQ